MLIDTNIGCNINGVSLNHLAYADDMVLLAPSSQAMHLLIKQCETFVNSHSMIYNVKKSVCMCVKPKWLNNMTVPSITLNGRILEYSSVQKYLGVLINSNFNDNDDQKRQLKSIYSSGNILIRKFRQCTDDVKDHLFQMYCTSLYCGHLWYTYSKTMFSKVKVAYNAIFRMLKGIDRKCSISQMMVNSCVPTFREIIRKQSSSFIMRLEKSENVCINAIYNSVFFQTSAILSHWLQDVYNF